MIDNITRSLVIQCPELFAKLVLDQLILIMTNISNNIYSCYLPNYILTL